jgi:hypothetical protein
MGKANRERRRMKEKARRRSPGDPSDSNGSGFNGSGFNGSGSTDRDWKDAAAWAASLLGPPPPPTATEQVQALLGEAVHAVHHGDSTTVNRLVRRLTVDDDPQWRGAVERALDGGLKDTITQLWAHGWQPADVLRQVTRHLKTPHQYLVRAAMAAEASGYAATTVDPRWSAQLEEAEVTLWWPRELTAVRACAHSHPEGWADFVARAVELLHELSCLPPLEILLPIPGSAVLARSGPRPEVDERLLARVRALLAKAESTNFPAEAETFTAGAQALMARHSIDHAMLAAAGRAPSDEPVGRRIGVDNPYEAPKATLLDAVASANRSRAVWSKNLGFATVIGHPTDLDTVEVLFTSLLVQATTAMTREGSRRYADGGSRTRTFRQSFLISYAHRIRERLTEATRRETRTAAAEPGNQNLLPVLASRDEAVQRTTAAMFPHITTRTAGSAWDQEGWARGRAAADLAALNPATPVTN